MLHKLPEDKQVSLSLREQLIGEARAYEYLSILSDSLLAEFDQRINEKQQPEVPSSV